MEVALSREGSERLCSQSPPLMTSYRLKPFHKHGPHNELIFGHLSRCYDMQRESDHPILMSVYKGNSHSTERPSKDDYLDGYEPIKDIGLPPP
jgi:hypothetical protein